MNLFKNMCVGFIANNICLFVNVAVILRRACFFWLSLLEPRAHLTHENMSHLAEEPFKCLFWFPTEFKMILKQERALIRDLKFFSF